MTQGRKNKDFNPNHCGVTHFLKRIGGQWKVLIVYGISLKVNRYSALKSAIPEISKQSLVNGLRELEEDRIITRFDFDEVPRRVEYQLTEYGETLLPVLGAIESWGQKDLKEINCVKQSNE